MRGKPLISHTPLSCRSIHMRKILHEINSRVAPNKAVWCKILISFRQPHEATNIDVVCIQETKPQPKKKNSETSALSDVIDQSNGKREQIPYTISHPQDNNSSAMENLTVDIPTPSSHTFTVSNWYLLSENSHICRVQVSHCRSSIQITMYTR